MVHEKLREILEEVYVNAKVSPSYDVDLEDMKGNIAKFIAVDFPLVYSSYKQLVTPPFKMDEPIAFVKVTSSAIQKGFYFLEGSDRRRLVIAIASYLKNNVFRGKADHLAWMLDEVFVGFVYDFFVRGR